MMVKKTGNILVVFLKRHFSVVHTEQDPEKIIIRLHKGTIAVTSTPSEKTVFKLRF